MKSIKNDSAFKAELKNLYENYTGRPSMLYEAKRMRADLGGPKIYLKREDLNHTGAHKINNCIGQALLAKRMGKTRLIAETGAGQHGVAAATIAALLGMECEIFMGEIDTERQALNVYRMRLLGAKVNAVKTGSRVLKDAVNAAFQNWSARCDDTHYLIGSCCGTCSISGNGQRLSVLYRGRIKRTDDEKRRTTSGCRICLCGRRQ